MAIPDRSRQLERTADGGAGLPPWAAALAVAAICLTFGLIGAFEGRHVSIAHGSPLGWATVLKSTMPRWLLPAASLPFVLLLTKRLPLFPPRLPALSLHFVLLLVLSFAEASAATWAMEVASPWVVIAFSWSGRMIRAWAETAPMMVSMYLAVGLAGWGMAEARERQRRTLRASQLEAQLQSARLASLRAQLQPHFLYNTLNGIAALVADTQPARAVAAIEHLADLLHASLRDDNRQQVSVTEEFGLAERYLALQGMRFGERLCFAMRIEPQAADCLVPVLLLQPLVENAVVHGLDGGRDRLHVTLSAAATRDGVELRVENDGSDPGHDRGRCAGHGVGLAATRARLTSAYGDLAELELRRRHGGGAVVRIVLPASPPALAPHAPRASAAMVPA